MSGKKQDHYHEETLLVENENNVDKDDQLTSFSSGFHHKSTLMKSVSRFTKHLPSSPKKRHNALKVLFSNLKLKNNEKLKLLVIVQYLQYTWQLTAEQQSFCEDAIGHEFKIRHD